MTCIYRRIALSFLTLSVACYVVAAESIYRCEQPDGTVSFQANECKGAGQAISVEPIGHSGWTALRTGEKQLLDGYRERDRARIQRRKEIAAARSKKDKVETPACWRKRKNLEKVKVKLRRGYKASEGESLRRKRDNYEEYLEKFCS